MRDLDVAVAPRVKICGIRNLAEALEAVSAGADALGFLVGLAYASDDAVDATTARQTIDKVPPYVSTVLVTHEADPARIVGMCHAAGCTTLQLGRCAQYPRGGTGRSWRRQSLASPLPERPNSLARCCTGRCPDPVIELAASEGEVLVHDPHLAVLGKVRQ
jgi:hypothetical protein